MIKEKVKREKRINSKKKGNSFELKIANLFKKRWGTIAYRTPSSGAYTSRVVSKAMKEAAIGDIVIENLEGVIIECKNYYSLHLSDWFKENPSNESIWSFWKKLDKEAKEFNKIPLLICKEANAPIIVIVALDLANTIVDNTGKFYVHFSLIREDTHLVVFALEELLSLDLETMQYIISNTLELKELF